MSRILRIFDIDDTICDSLSQGPYDVVLQPHIVGTLQPFPAVAKVAADSLRRPDTWVRFVSGRGEDIRRETLQWLNRNVGPLSQAANPVELLLAGRSPLGTVLAKQKLAADAARSLVRQLGDWFLLVEAWDDNQRQLMAYAGALEPFGVNLKLHLAVKGAVEEFIP